MEETEKKELDKKKEKGSENPHKKTVLITTDGDNVEIQWDNVNKLEIEMMLVKALRFVKSQS